MRYIITGHGYYPKGIVNTLTFLVGKRDDIDVIAEEDGNNGYKEEIDRILNEYKDDDLIFFTDIKEGSINQYLMKKLKDHSFWLITGYNIALLLELLFTSEVTKESLNETIAEARKQMVYVKDLLSEI